MYKVLAQFYDPLVKDEKATQDWVDFIEKHASFQSLIEYACGSGEITLALARKGYHVQASDLSEDMVKQAQSKKDAEKVEFSVWDMREAQEGKADLVLCLCDSMNYLHDDHEFKQVLRNAYNNLNDKGTFIFDVHSLDRLEEFEEEFYEEGLIDGKGYEWSIESHQDTIFQNFVFFDEEGHATYEQHIQKVFHPEDIKKWIQECGFDYEVYTDFKTFGIAPGEKYFYICRRK